MELNRLYKPMFNAVELFFVTNRAVCCAGLQSACFVNMGCSLKNGGVLFVNYEKIKQFFYYHAVQFKKSLLVHFDEHSV
jgi:hypothetical protein